MLDTHIKNGFVPIMPPLLCKPETMQGSGQLPKFENQLFEIIPMLIPASFLSVNPILIFSYLKIFSHQIIRNSSFKIFAIFLKESKLLSLNKLNTTTSNEVGLFDK